MVGTCGSGGMTTMGFGGGGGGGGSSLRAQPESAAAERTENQNCDVRGREGCTVSTPEQCHDFPPNGRVSEPFQPGVKSTG
jgi:hypothetical protein